MRAKICGITRLEDANLAVECGAWAIGFIFYDKSPRYVSTEVAAQIVRGVDQPSLKKVGVFVNPSLEQVLHSVTHAGLTSAQLHGAETPEFCRSLKAAAPTLGVIKAFRPQNEADIGEIYYYKGIDSILIDSFVVESPEILGGTGMLSKWELAIQAKQFGEVILSGGLSPENIGRALHEVTPFAVDVSSQLESSPGKKDSEKVRAFFAKGKLHGNVGYL